MDYKELLKSYEPEMLQKVKELNQIASVNAAPVTTANGEVLPFGVEVQKSLEYMLELGASMGFETVNIDNYGGHIEFRDEDSEGVFGITVHLDVMPEGNGWDYPCFDLTEDNGTLYGRGIVDDKGPAIAVLYAMKAMKESGMKPKMAVRLIMGLDEEVGTLGIKNYLEKAGHPDMGFTPDAEFPLMNGEMGVMIFDLCRKLTPASKDGLRLTKIDGGIAANVVPAECKAVITSKDKEVYDSIKEMAEIFTARTGHKVTAKKQGSSIALVSEGKSVHGAYPASGLNAISIMMDFLGGLTFACEETNEVISFYNEHIGYNTDGKGIGCDYCDEPSGDVRVNVGVAKFDEEMASLTLNVRVPVTYKNDDIYTGLETVLPGTGIGIVKKTSEPSLYMEKTHPLVEKLVAAYREVTGDAEAEPFVCPGGTYAKAVNCTLAFGPSYPNVIDAIHEPNERVTKELYFLSAQIYAQAIDNMCF